MSVSQYSDSGNDFDDSTNDDLSTSAYNPDIYYSPQDSSVAGNSRYYSQPLISFVKNDRRGPSERQRNRRPKISQLPRWIQILLMPVSAPKFRRYVPVFVVCVLLFLCLWKLVVTPQFELAAELTNSLDPEFSAATEGWFGVNSLPRFTDLVKIGNLDPSLLPADLAVTGEENSGKKRLIFVGDVHGCKSECMCFHASSFIYISARLAKSVANLCAPFFP